MEHAWGEWSEWGWDASQGRHYRVRQDAQGKYDWEYFVPPAPEQAAPRGHVDELADTLQNVSLGDNQNPTYAQQSAYSYSGQAATDGGTASVFSASSVQAQSAYQAKGKGRDSRSRGHREREAPKGPKKPRQRSNRAYEDDREFPADPTANEFTRDPFYQRPGGASGSSHASAYSEAQYRTSPHDAGYTSGHPQSSGSHQSYYQNTSARHYEEPEPASPGQQADRGHDSDPETTFSRSTAAAEDLTVEEQGSSYYTASGSLAGDVPGHESVTQDLEDTISQIDPYTTGAVGGSYSPGESSSMATASAYSYSAYGVDTSGRDTPKPLPQQSAPPTGAEAYSYRANPPVSVASQRELEDHEGYTVHPSSKFRPGAIFKILWSEPLGTGAGSPRSEVPTYHRTFEDGAGQAFYQGLRRFIVVANDEGNCTCVPILTYERQGCNKRGVKPLKHGIIYQAGKKPRMLPGEPRLGFDPVRVHLREKAEQLIKESRVNYAKLQTVEHNFRVFFIGKVDADDFANIVRPAVDICWGNKWRHTNY